ncbi:enterobactin ABC transporter permease, partial [Yersinia sp. LJYL362]
MQANEYSSPSSLSQEKNKILSSPAKRLLLLSIIALVAMVIFMTINLRGNIQYVLVHRGLILATMVLVAFAAGIATVLFQTVTNNRILTPSVMGLEALFILIQTMLIFFVDANGFRVLGITGKFLCESALL